MHFSRFGMAALVAIVAADDLMSSYFTVTSTCTTTTTTTVTVGLPSSTSTPPFTSIESAAAAPASEHKSVPSSTTSASILENSTSPAAPTASAPSAAHKIAALSDITGNSINDTDLLKGINYSLANVTASATPTSTASSIATGCKVITGTVPPQSVPSGVLDPQAISFCLCHDTEWAALTTSIATDGATMTVCDYHPTAIPSTTAKVITSMTNSSALSSASASSMTTSSASPSLAGGAALHQLPCALCALVVALAAALYYG